MAGQTIGKVVAGGKTHTVTSTFYGTCATAAGTALKEVIINEINTTEALSFINGMTLTVKFTNANTHATPTMTLFNNSGTAAAPTKGSTTLLANKQIMRYGTTKPGNSAAASWQAGSVVTFVYDGTYWQITNWLNNNDNTVPCFYIGTGAATAAKAATLTTGGWNTANTTAGTTVVKDQSVPLYAMADIYYDNTAASAITLTVSGWPAKPIWINGAASSATNYALPRGTYITYYDGAKFHFRTDGKIPGPSTSGTIEEILISESSPAVTDDYTKIWIEI